jgi:hypothetical protein
MKQFLYARLRTDFSIVLVFLIHSGLNPDFAVGIVMKGKKAIKTGV